jgi:hypothetical protein
LGRSGRNQGTHLARALKFLSTLKSWFIPKAALRNGLSHPEKPTAPLIDIPDKTCRTIEQAHADLVAKFAQDPHPDLARMIGSLELEIAQRSRGKHRAETGH